MRRQCASDEELCHQTVLERRVPRTNLCHYLQLQPDDESVRAASPSILDCRSTIGESCAAAVAMATVSTARSSYSGACSVLDHSK